MHTQRTGTTHTKHTRKACTHNAHARHIPNTLAKHAHTTRTHWQSPHSIRLWCILYGYLYSGIYTSWVIWSCDVRYSWRIFDEVSICIIRRTRSLIQLSHWREAYMTTNWIISLRNGKSEVEFSRKIEASKFILFLSMRKSLCVTKYMHTFASTGACASLIESSITRITRRREVAAFSSPLTPPGVFIACRWVHLGSLTSE